MGQDLLLTMPDGETLSDVDKSGSGPVTPATRKLTQVVSHVQRSGNATRLQLMNGVRLSLHPYIYVHEGDVLDVSFDGESLSEVYRHVKFAPANHSLRVKIYPPYCRTEVLRVPPHKLNVTFRERRSASDWRAAKLLEQFHYRGQGLNKLVGRRTVLILEDEHQGIIGYGVLSATVAAAKPRFTLLKTNFTAQMKSKLINQIARIPRVVIHPEFRGMGLGALMAKHLVAYAKEYWDINGYRPMMVEVIAAMTEYHRFFEQAGFVKAGSTLGYSKGIIPVYGFGSWESRPNHSKYNFFGHQKSKPYLVYPLSEEVTNMLRENHLLKETKRRPARRAPQLGAPIRFRKVCVTYKASNGLTPRAADVKNAFAVDSEQMYSPILTNFSLTIRPGDVVLFTGASGSGKSTIVKLLTESADEIDAIMEVSGTIEGIDPSQIAELNRSWDENLPLIEQVGQSTKEAIAILNGVGLTEAHLYVKRCSQISEGQKYRFAVAKLCNSKKPIWVADEFASTLDPQTAAIVAKGLRKLAFQHGATVILAAPHIGYFVDSLLPTKLIHLRWGGFAKIYSVILCHKRQGEAIEVWARNDGREGLSMAIISGLTQASVQEPLLELDSLGAGECTPKVLLEPSKLQRYSALVLTCTEGVGDVMRLEQALVSTHTEANMRRSG